MPVASPVEARVEIAGLIGDSILQALALKESLEDERTALETQDIDTLESIVARKTRIAESLQALDRKRDALCQQWGFASGPDQMQQVIDWCDESEIVSERWAQLIDVAAEGSALNLTNGAIIRVRQQHFESSLSVLRGVPPGADTYSRNGEGSGDFSRRSLAEV